MITTTLFDFYKSEYPTDDMGEDIKRDITFGDLFDFLDMKRDDEDIYDFIGAADSLIRERLFAELSNISGHDYEEIYNQWLYGNTMGC